MLNTLRVPTHLEDLLHKIPCMENLNLEFKKKDIFMENHGILFQLFIYFFQYQNKFCRISFLSPARRSGGGGYWRRLICPSVRLSVPPSRVRMSAFRFRSRTWLPVHGFLQFLTHTSLRGCRCAFWSF